MTLPTKPPAPPQKTWKELYREQYAVSKIGGERFFPDVLWRDAVVALLVVSVIFILATFFPASSADPANPTGQTYNPRPEWYFFFFYEWLRLFPGSLEPLVAVVIPVAAIIVLFLMPFYSRGLDRSWAARKLSLTIGGIVVAGIATLEIVGALTSPPETPTAPTPVSVGTYADLTKAGQTLYVSNCGLCHGNSGEGASAPALIGSNSHLATYQTGKGLLDYTVRTMPVGATGSLTNQEYLDIIAYILIHNNFVAGNVTFDEANLPSVILVSATPSTLPTPTSVTGASFADLASAGQPLYASSCGSCHGNNGQGASAPAVIGNRARLSSYRNAKGLLDYLAATMPPGARGNLTHQQYLEITAYLLVQNNYVAGFTVFNEANLSSTALTTAALSVTPTPTGTATPPPTPVTGATFADLANAGQPIYSSNCGACHGNNGQGASAPALIGSRAQLSSFQTAKGLMDYNVVQMPPRARGSLTHQEYLDILAYLLVQNNYVAGTVIFNEANLPSIALR